MNPDNIQTQMRRGTLELCTLALLAKGDAYTNDIVNALRDAEMIVVEGAIYPILTRLKNAGYLSYRWEESPQGPPRKYYELTPTGRDYLNLLADTWKSVVSTVNLLIDSTPTCQPDNSNL